MGYYRGVNLGLQFCKTPGRTRHKSMGRRECIEKSEVSLDSKLTDDGFKFLGLVSVANDSPPAEQAFLPYVVGLSGMFDAGD